MSVLRFSLVFLFMSVCAISWAESKPNIVFIFADDWGWGDLSCHGHPYVRTPNIDSLAREGTDFHRFTVASGVCSPSRTAVLTGKFPARFNINGHFAWVPQNAKRNMPDWLDTSVSTLPSFLKSAGYTTAHFGKWHLSNDMIPDSPSPLSYGYDEYGAFNCSGEQMPVHADAEEAIRFIEAAHGSGKPFFINLWIHEPHTPFHTVPKYEWRFREMQNRSDAIYASVLSHADDRIGRVLQTLERLGIKDNTLVIFSSDNGPARSPANPPPELIYDTATGAGWGIGAAKGLTGGRKGYKAALFEGGVGVPFIARWPGKVPAGKVDYQSMISAVDLLPTFCELAGLSLPEGYQGDGISQVQALQGKGGPKRSKPLFWKMQSVWPPRKDRPHHWVAYAMVSEEWKLLTNEQSTYFELYHLVDDPYEAEELSKLRPDVVETMRIELNSWKESLPEAPVGDVFSSLRAESADE